MTDRRWKDEGNALKGTGAVEATHSDATEARARTSVPGGAGPGGNTEAATTECERSESPPSSREGNDGGLVRLQGTEVATPREAGGGMTESREVARTQRTPEPVAGCNRPAEPHVETAEAGRNGKSGTSEMGGTIAGERSQGREARRASRVIQPGVSPDREVTTA